MFYSNYLKKRYYRITESLIKKILLYKNNTKNDALQKAIRSAIYYTTGKNEILFSNNKKIKYLLNSRDWISLKLFIDRSFDYSILNKATKLLGKKHLRSTLINIGAHLGSSCIPAVKENKFANSIVFEPTKKTYKLLKANILLNDVDDRIQAYNLALSNKKTKLYLAINKGNVGGNYIAINKSKHTEIVKSDILDNYTYNLNKNNTLIFMDVEGHEPNVFLGAKKTIKKKIPFVFEFYPALLKKNWIKSYDLIFKNYKFFYDLRGKNKKQKLNKANLMALINKVNLIEGKHTDLMII